MKFTTIKVLISIFALIQLSFSTILETKAKSTTESLSSTSAKTESNSKIKSSSTVLSKAKSSSNSQLKSQVSLGSKANIKSSANLNSKSTTDRNTVIDLNNMFNPDFGQKIQRDSVIEEISPVQRSPVPRNSVNKKYESPSDLLVKDPSKIDQILTDWLMVASEAFKDKAKFPDIYIRQTDQYLRIRVDNMNFRINDSHEKDDNTENIPNDPNCFWFRLSGLNIYYSSTKTDINILGSISIASVVGLISLEGDHSGYHCFIIKDNAGTEWKVCSNEKEKRNKWVCRIQTTLGVKLESFCDGGKEDPIVVPHNIIQPYIVIPLPSRKCNEKWNYQQFGRDWECECAEGKEQSPIDLPRKEEAIDTNIRPLFQYERIDPVSKITTIDGQMQENQNIQIKLEDGALRIKHMKFGKVVTVDGAVYHAEEIIIHTPSEHKINGKQYDMEVQIIHYGQSKGDIAKQLTLSFLFEKKAGVYNKFLDDLDFFNLPNPLTPKVDLLKDIFIPKILYEASNNEIPVMKPFSFYTYQGSISFPPCVEDTIVYVASKPLYVGTTALQLFSEALRVPDFQTHDGNIIVSDWILNSRREIQPLNGRPVFHYDHVKQCGPDKEIKPIEQGHYEKIQKTLTKYFYVNDEKPSGIPNAFVVSKEEALGVGGLKNGNKH